MGGYVDVSRLVGAAFGNELPTAAAAGEDETREEAAHDAFAPPMTAVRGKAPHDVPTGEFPRTVVFDVRQEALCKTRQTAKKWSGVCVVLPRNS